METFVPGSSHIDRVDYDREVRGMTITFKDGRSYTYENVPPDVFFGLQHAPSAGSYFARHVKDRYVGTEV